MRVGDLSRATGVPVATIKYYQREGLLPHGERAGYNQVSYTDEHVRRLRLVRALVDVGGLSITATSQVLAAIGDAGDNLFSALGKVHYAVTASTREAPESTDRVDELLDRLGWKVKAGNPSRAALAGLLDTFTDLGHADLLDRLDDYAEHAAALAALDVAGLEIRDTKDEKLEATVVMTVLGDVLVSLLRRMAQEHLATGYRPAQ